MGISTFSVALPMVIDILQNVFPRVPVGKREEYIIKTCIFHLDFFTEKHRICVQCTGRKIAAVEGIQIHQERLEARMAGEVHFL